MSTQTHAQGLNRSGSEELPELSREDNGTQVPIPSPEAVSNKQPLTKEMFVFSNTVSLGIQTTLKKGLMASSSWSTQNELTIFGDFVFVSLMRLCWGIV